MPQPLHELAFPATDRDAWRRDVETALRGRSFDEALVRRTGDGLSLEPLYTRSDRPAGMEHETPGAAPFVRGFPAPGTAAEPRRGWIRCVEIAHPEIRRANAMILADLEGGAERVRIRATAPRRALTEFADPVRLAERGRGGVWVEGAADLGRLLHGVRWSLAPVSLLAPADASLTHALFAACDTLRQRDGQGVAAQIDLFGHAAQAGDPSAWLTTFADPIADEVNRALAAEPVPADARPLWISTTELRRRGADFVQETAAGLALFVEAVRAFGKFGLAPAATLRASEFSFGIGTDFFGEIAKLRAFRRCLALVLDTIDIADRGGDAMVTASTAEETLAARDVHVNLLRTTSEAASAILGGADCVTVLPFDGRLQGGATLGRRLARNIHSLLAEESDAGAVVDAAGGSYYLEHRTEQLAEAAWRQFVEWEKIGGFLAGWRQGPIPAAIGERWRTRAARLRSRRDSVLGVNAFPQLAEKRPEIEPFDAAGFVQQWRERLGVTPGATTHAVGTAATTASHYLGEDFEALRDIADRLAARSGSPPTVYGALLGAASSYAARLDWVRDLLASAGLDLHEHAAGDSGDDAAAGFESSGARSAIIVAADALHDSTVPCAASALREAGAAEIIVAGRPGAQEASQRQAGVTGYVHAGVDAIPLLSRLLVEAEAAHGTS